MSGGRRNRGSVTAVADPLGWLRGSLSERWNRWLVCACLIAHAVNASIGLSAPLLEHHAFRQTQTALTAYWTVQEGVRLAYLTPVLGPPWSIPFEFPLFQWVVAGVHVLTGAPLDVTGRLVSLAAFYVSLVPGFALFRRLLGGERQATVALCFVLASPTYLFWSRAFLIESTALALAITHLLLVVRALERPRGWRIVAAALVGVVAGLVKATTLAVLLVPLALVVAVRLFGLARAHQFRRTAETAMVALASTVPGVVAVQVWTSWCDHVKRAGPYTASLTSDSLRAWNFGTFAQRLDPSLWWSWVVEKSGLAMTLRALPRPLGIVLGTAVVAGVVWSLRRYWNVVVIASATILAGPLLFFNLYRHDYYQFVTGFALSLLVAVPFLAMIEAPAWKVARAGKALATGTLLLFLAAYPATRYFQRQLRGYDIETLRVAKFVADHTDREDVVLYLGFDWTSKYAYYSERRSLMLREAKLETLEDPRFERFCRDVAREHRRVTAVVFSARPRREVVRRLVAIFRPSTATLSAQPPVLLLGFSQPNAGY